MAGVPSVPAAQHSPDGATMTHAPATTAAPQQRRRRTPRAAVPSAQPPRRRRRIRHAGAIAFVLVVLGVLGSAGYLALQSVYFIGTNSRGLVTMFEGVPYQLPGNIDLYNSQYVSGVSASTLSAEKRHTLLDHSLRSEGDAAALIRSLELEQLE
jgi:protein phosphatase